MIVSLENSCFINILEAFEITFIVIPMEERNLKTYDCKDFSSPGKPGEEK